MFYIVCFFNLKILLGFTEIIIVLLFKTVKLAEDSLILWSTELVTVVNK